jgi:hypothetical protein
MRSVGHNALAGIDQCSFNPTGRKRSFHDSAGEHLAKRGHVVGGTRSQLTDRDDTAQKLIQGLKINS